MSNYPKTAEEAAEYLKEYPYVNVYLPRKHHIYRFLDFDNVRMQFQTDMNETRNIPVTSTLKKARFYENGFTWSMHVGSGEISIWYIYTGPMPWKEDQKNRQAEWNDVLAGIQNFD